MATLMRCTMPHWQGNKFVDVGTVLPAGHPEAIAEFFAAIEIDMPEDTTALRQAAEAKGVRVDKRWGADRLREEIAKAED